MQSKPVDLKTLLDRIEKLAVSSPDLADDLSKEFHLSCEHLRQMDRNALRAETIVTYLGQIFGLIIGLVAIVSGALTATYGSQPASRWVGGLIGGGGVIGLVSVFVLGRRKTA